MNTNTLADSAHLKFLGIKLNKFQVGQLLFILSVTFGLFMSDTARKILLIGAFMTLNFAQLKWKFWQEWSKEQKISGYILISLWSWLFLIPLLFGVDPIMLRLQSTGWEIELFLFMWGALLFARDDFFIVNLKRFAIVACTSYAVLAAIQRYSLGFVVNFDNWPLDIGAWSVGTIFSVLVPWTFYELLFCSLKKAKIFLFTAIIGVTSLILFLTMYSTFWLSLVVQIFVAIVILACLCPCHRRKIMFISICLAGCLACFLYLMSMYHTDLYNRIAKEFAQISISKDFDMEKFTNQRYHIWVEAVSFIKQRPILGYGWAEFADFSAEQRSHTHNAFLQAAWTGGWPAMLLLIAFLFSIGLRSVSLLKAEKKVSMIPFVVLLVLSAFITCGILDDMFRATRRIVTLYWVVFMLPLTPLWKRSENNKNNIYEKAGDCSDT